MFTMTDAEKEHVASRMINHFYGCGESTFKFLIYKDGKACFVFCTLRCSSQTLQLSSKLASCPPRSGAMASQPTKKDGEAKKRPAANAADNSSPTKTIGLSASATSTTADTTSWGHGQSSGIVEYPTVESQRAMFEAVEAQRAMCASSSSAGPALSSDTPASYP